MIRKNETNNVIVVRLQNVRKHPNADRLQLATVLGTQVIIGLDMKENDLVLYFDANLRLGVEYIRYNNLSSSVELNEDPKAKGYFPKSGRVCAQKFRGSFSNGFVAPIDSIFRIPDVNVGGVHVADITEGLEFTHVNDVEIASKYCIPVSISGAPGAQNSRSKKFKCTVEHFWKHWDTKQLMRCLNQIGDEGRSVYVEEKIHGTSGRTGHVLVKNNRAWWQFWIPREEWKIISGTRRTDHIHGHIHAVRQSVEDQVRSHLHKGEQIYYEIFGYDVGGKAIQEGFSYGCRSGEFKVMLYRVTITTADGISYDLDREQVYARARELGMCVPPHRNYIVDQVGAQRICECMGNLPTGTDSSYRSTFDPNTLFEGIVVWFQNDEGRWTCLKYKSEEFFEFTSKQVDAGLGDVEDTL
jgi:hypothetical protein